MRKSQQNSNGITPFGAPNRGGVGSNWRFSTSILRQYPWMTLKVTFAVSNFSDYRISWNVANLAQIYWHSFLFLPNFKERYFCQKLLKLYCVCSVYSSKCLGLFLQGFCSLFWWKHIFLMTLYRHQHSQSRTSEGYLLVRLYL